MDERVRYFRAKTGRDVEYNMLVQHVEVTGDRANAAEAWHEKTKRSAVPDARELLDAPQLLLGTVEEIAEQLETFAPVLNELQ